MSTPTYAYANNNPLYYTDPDGRFVMFAAIPLWAWVVGGGVAGFGLGFGASQLMPTTTTTLDPTMGGRGMRGGRPRIPGTTCSSQPLDEKQQECKREANNAGTRAIMQGKSDEEANLARAASYCFCMGANDSSTCAEELARIGWSGYQ